MTYRVVILARARQDVEQIYDWIAQRSPDGAQRWLDRFGQATGTLETNPFLGPLAPESKFFDIEIRHILFRTLSGRPYRAIFVVIDDEVRILRVRGPGQRLLRPRDVNLE
jgi:toxin ParE1/3/4